MYNPKELYIDLPLLLPKSNWGLEVIKASDYCYESIDRINE